MCRAMSGNKTIRNCLVCQINNSSELVRNLHSQKLRKSDGKAMPCMQRNRTHDSAQHSALGLPKALDPLRAPKLSFPHRTRHSVEQLLRQVS